MFKRFFQSHAWRSYGQFTINWIVFISIARWIILKAWKWHQLGELFQFVEFTFLLHILLLLVLVVIRRPHKEIDTNIFKQAVAMIAFFSGIAFFGPKTENSNLILAARIITSIALVLGILTQLNLGRSFGILIARREIKTRFLYGIIRHPMYLTDMLFSIGMILKMPSWPNGGILLLSVACYMYRAILEERFLSRSDQYMQYMNRVKYRFIPGIF